MNRGQNYRQSLPGSTASSMTPATPMTRKRKRGPLDTTPLSSGLGYREENEVDNCTGQIKSVIIIEDDTPEPPPTIPASSIPPTNGHGNGHLPSKSLRTRAQVAAAQAANAGVPASAAAPPPPKRRRRDQVQQPSSAAVPTRKPFPQITSKPWPSTSTDASAASSQASKAAPSCDDADGHYVINPDDVIGKRYRIIKLLGQGTFGKVVEAYDSLSSKRVAIKIIRAIPKYREASTIEIRVLRLLKDRDPTNMYKCIHLMETFDHRNHVCIVTELLGMCIYDFLKENDFRPFPRPQILQFAQQLLSSVAFLHDLQLIHTDLKPENILLVNSASRVVTEVATAPGRRPQTITRKILYDCTIRLIDFGSATFEREYHSTVVCTRHYRAPEIILGLGWSYPCDAFSLGCIFVEFYTGVALYQTHDNLEHLAMMEMVMGRMPERFARKGASSKAEYFKDGARLDWPKPKATKQSRRDVKATKPLHEIIRFQDQYNRHFFDLVRQLLEFDPALRLKVRKALEHQYFTIGPPPDPL
ncbi:dual specificity protein kinase kns1 [Serendipita sp. 396]|nr:dual specificity protein kinase kns1 [Serendipita sp. 396]KAG8782214.1 dual specificity protein kinase kns1 [Serendipita sp. 397]KAG8792234.1 dual specificity protein kinase kns1 [Serendipita sp. 398]KAG8824350.1 dual specificity protein kinase kns1 [Serendipita sp. 401]KAG8832982.1 dual specificity protein kinase kns1 [Serendipita sp. 400]KAG8861579.1 dual specificity protein kinase kns1 [Serendipita sp. 411]KAG8866762.1 dual specificity protein kinase kns1 [Serendipita sp. 405]KAG905553